jgi:hypothetical protein
MPFIRKLAFAVVAALILGISFASYSRAANQPKIEASKVSADEWQHLIAAHFESPCLNDRTPKCLLREAGKLRPLTNAPLVIAYGDEQLARQLSSSLPDDAMRMRQHMQLLFTIREDKKATEILRNLQEQRKTGTDFGAILALLGRGDPDAALDIAKMTIDWPYVDPNHGLIVSIGQCANSEALYPGPIQRLAEVFVSRNELDKAKTALDLIKRYWDNKLNGHHYDNCSFKNAKWAYYGAAVAVAQGFSKAGQKDKAKEIFADLVERMPKFGTTNYNFPDYKDVATEMSAIGLKEEAAKLAELVKKDSWDAYGTGSHFYAGNNYDAGVLIYGIADKYPQAFERLSAITDETLKYHTTVLLAQDARDKGDVKDLREILKLMRTSLGKSSDSAADIVGYLQYAELSLDAGEKQESKESTAEAVKIYESSSSTTSTDNLQAKPHFALLFARYEDYASMRRWLSGTWVPAFDPKSANTLFVELLLYAIKKDDWKLYDYYFDHKKELFGVETEDFSNTGNLDTLLSQLLSKDQFARYEDLIESSGDKKYRHFRWSALTAKEFDSKESLSDETLKKAWRKNLEACYWRMEDTAPERLAACYTEIVDEISHDRKIVTEWWW